MADSGIIERLSQGSAAWNAWRRSEPETAIEIAGIQLPPLDLRHYQLDRVDLRATDLSACTLDGSTSLDGITLNTDTRWPAGFTPMGRGMNHAVVAHLPIAATASANAEIQAGDASAPASAKDVTVDTSATAGELGGPVRPAGDLTLRVIRGTGGAIETGDSIAATGLVTPPRRVVGQRLKHLTEDGQAGVLRGFEPLLTEAERRLAELHGGDDPLSRNIDLWRRTLREHLYSDDPNIHQLELAGTQLALLIGPTDDQIAVARRALNADSQSGTPAIEVSAAADMLDAARAVYELRDDPAGRANAPVLTALSARIDRIEAKLDLIAANTAPLPGSRGLGARSKTVLGALARDFFVSQVSGEFRALPAILDALNTIARFLYSTIG